MPTSTSEGRGKWRRKPKDSKPINPKRHRPEDEEDDDEEEENEAAAAVEVEEDEDLHPNPNSNSKSNPNLAGASRRSEPAVAARESEVLSDGGIRISDFPAAVRRTVVRPHPSVVALTAAERAAAAGDSGDREKLVSGAVLENVSYGQLQALSSVTADNPALAGETESSGSYVAVPPPIMKGKGVLKKFWNRRVHVVPMHADWFSPTSVNRLERQVVPHFFSDKSEIHTPERYMECRNLMVAKYMENPEKRLSVGDCQGLAAGVSEEDTSRIFRFLDNWGIVNYCAPAAPNHLSWNVDSFLRADASGELHVPSAALKSIDSLIKFDKPKCRLKPEDVYPSVPSNADDSSDLDNRIREELSENRCNHCSQPLLLVYYQSLKDAEKSLCRDCYHEGRFVVGHSSIDFSRVDSANDLGDVDTDSWTDQETLLLLEAVEIFDNNWNEIADYVGSKSKAQCILHFLRLPMEDGLLENLDVPHRMPTAQHVDENKGSYVNSNGNSTSVGTSAHGSDSDRLPFANSANPVMSLVAFLASSVGPRVAAACAHASLAALTEEDGLPHFENTFQADGSAHGNTNRLNSEDSAQNSGQHKDASAAAQVSEGQTNAAVSALSDEKVRSAAKAGLAAAALKAKLFSDHEEREIQRLTANIINHQLKRLELKLKQFAEVETLLMKECEQVERTRQRLGEERMRILSSRFGSTGFTSPSSLPPGMTTTPPPSVGMMTTHRPNAMSMSMSTTSTGQAPIGPGGFNSHPQMGGHLNMPISSSPSFIQRQQQPQQMFSFGPRLPLSVIHPSPSSSSSPSLNPMFSPQGGGGGGGGASSSGHPVLRPVSGTTSSGHG